METLNLADANKKIEKKIIQERKIYVQNQVGATLCICDNANMEIIMRTKQKI